MKKIVKSFIAVVILFCVVFVAYGEENEKDQLDIRIDQIISDQYPDVRAYTIIKNSEGELVSGLSPSLFSFRVDSAEVKVKSEITPFAMSEESTDYIIMVSNNGIMEGEPLDFQKNAILKSVELMDEDDTLSVYTIGEDAGVVCENIDKKTFDSAVINSIEISSAQPRLYDSIINLLRKVEQKDGKRKVVIILSDGRDQNSRFTKEELVDTLEKVGIPIYAVGMRILSNETLSILDEITQLTGGAYYYSSRLSNIPDNLKKIIECCSQSYIIDLKIKGLKADNRTHILEIKVDERDAEGKGLKTFVAVKLPFPKWLRILLIIISIVFVLAFIIVLFIRKIQKRKRMGITKRRCPICRNIMKDSWESCPFCKYLPQTQKKKKGDQKEKNKE